MPGQSGFSKHESLARRGGKREQEMKSNDQKKQRLKEARVLAGVSLRSVARKTGIPIATLRQQEESDDISLRDLCLWQDALGVPLSELVHDTPERTDDVLRMRAGLIQLMRSVKSLQSGKLTERQDAIVQNMAAELEAMMPELAHIKSWPQSVGRRRPDQPGRIESQVIATSIWCPEMQSDY